MAVLPTPRVVPFRGAVPGPPRSYRVVSEFEHSSVPISRTLGIGWLNDLNSKLNLCL